MKFFSRNDFNFTIDDFQLDFLFALEFFPPKILAFTAGRFSEVIFVFVEVFHAENLGFEVGRNSVSKSWENVIRFGSTGNLLCELNELLRYFSFREMNFRGSLDENEDF